MTLPELGLSVKRLQVKNHRAATEALKPLGITLVQWDALRHLHQNPGASLHDLAVLTFQTDQAFGTLAARLEVVQGALRVTRQGDRVLVETGGAANRAFLGFFDETRRYAGLSLPLVPAADGRLVGEAAWPAGLVATPLWVVSSSQPDLASPSAVGWPILTAGEPDPKTFDAKELLLLDGAAAARAREERRARRIRLVSAAYASLALFVTLALFVRRVREAEEAMDRHLRRSGLDELAPGIAPKRQGRAVLAAACIALGFVVLALFALLKE